MRRSTLLVTVGLLAASPALASAGNLDLRLGTFLPRAQMNPRAPMPTIFTDDSDLYTLKPGAGPSGSVPPGLGRSDWDGFTGGIAYNARVARNVELGVSLDGYGRTLDTSYRRFHRTDGTEIRQTLKLNIVPIGVTLRIVPTSRHQRLAPFVAVGVDVFYWRYEEFGDFIDFQSAGRPISFDDFVSDGVTPGLHAAGGLRIPFGDDFAIVGEARYQLAKKVDMGGDFRQNQLDLNGLSATVGLNIRF